MKSMQLDVSQNKTSFKPSYLFISLSALVIAVASGLYSVTDYSKLWHDLTDGFPMRGDLGFGKFEIYGGTIAFEYPFRLWDRTWLSAILPWLCYIPHQLLQWRIIYQAKQAHAKGLLQWTSFRQDGWNPFAWKMLQVNVVFTILHFWQSHYSYDGLGATLPEISVLCACISIIIFPFAFEVRRRGILFGWLPVKGRSAIMEFANAVGKNHAYFVVFGITITFWYHPTEATLSHITGFAHIFLLLWQSSMLFHTEHKNKWWNAFGLEFTVIVHTSIVSYFQGFANGILFKMYFTSFIFMFCASTVWGLPPVIKYVNGNLNDKKIEFDSKKGLRVVKLIVPMAILYSFVVYFVYSSQPQFSPMILGLPVTYLLIIVWYYGFFALGKKVANSSWGQNNSQSGRLQQALFGIGALSISILMVSFEIVYRHFIPYSRHPK